MTASVELDLADAYFLHQHPGWTYRDLMDAPSDVVSLMRLIGTTEAEVRASRARSGG